MKITSELPFVTTLGMCLAFSFCSLVHLGPRPGLAQPGADVLFDTVWLETITVLARGDGTSLQRGGVVWHAGRTPRVDGEKAGAELRGGRWQKGGRTRDSKTRRKKDEFVVAPAANPRRQLMEGGGTAAKHNSVHCMKKVM